MIYQGYKTAKYAKKIIDKLEDPRIKEELIELGKKKTSSIGQKLFEEKINNTTNSITNYANETRLIQLISRTSGLDETAVETLFKKTLHNSLEDGIGTITNLAVDGIF